LLAARKKRKDKKKRKYTAHSRRKGK